MHPDALKLLEAIRDAGSFVLDVVRDCGQGAYEQNRLARQAVERPRDRLARDSKRTAPTRCHRGDVNAGRMLRPSETVKRLTILPLLLKSINVYVCIDLQKVFSLSGSSTLANRSIASTALEATDRSPPWMSIRSKSVPDGLGRPSYGVFRYSAEVLRLSEGTCSEAAARRVLVQPDVKDRAPAFTLKKLQEAMIRTPVEPDPGWCATDRPFNFHQDVQAVPGAKPCDEYLVWWRKRPDSEANERESRRRLAEAQASGDR